MDMQSAIRSWSPPEPRAGLAGEWDKFIGPGAARAEVALILIVAVGSGLAMIVFWWLRPLDWTWLQVMVATLLAIDLAGGVVANATTAAKRWYHRAGQGVRQQMVFVTVHVVEIFLVSWLFLGLDWLYFGLGTAFLLTAAFAIVRSPLYLRRPVSLALYGLGLLVAIYVLKQPEGMEWFIPILYLKLLVSHLLPEAPFSPAGTSLEDA